VNGTIDRIHALPPIDWSDLERAHDICEDVLSRLAADVEAMRELCAGVLGSEKLLGLSENLALDDKLVLVEALSDRGFRIRLHISKGELREVPHDHRFPFTTLMLSGGYWQRFYEADRPLREVEAEAHLWPTHVRFEDPGACYTMHEDMIHSNIALPDTALLLMRGPATKACAWALNRKSGALAAKFGAAEEGAEVRAKHAMTPARFEELTAQLRRISLL
jgi:hypothetical protein